jgi:hypothetical protein
MDIKKELSDIGALIRSEKLIAAVRQEVKTVFGKKALVLGGKFGEQHSNEARKYDMIVVHKAGDKETELIARRLAKIPDIEVKQLSGLTDKVIGIRQARRMKDA